MPAYLTAPWRLWRRCRTFRRIVLTLVLLAFIGSTGARWWHPYWLASAGMVLGGLLVSWWDQHE